MGIPGEGEEGDIYPHHIGASLGEIYKEETGLEAHPIAERISHRPRLLRYFKSAIEERDQNAPQVVKHLVGSSTDYRPDQDPRAHAVAQYKIELVGKFSELAEPGIEADLLHPDRGILEALEELIEEMCDPGADQTDLARKMMILTEISHRYKQDARE